MNTRRILAGLAVLVLLIVLWFAISPPRLWLNLTKQVDLSDPVATGEQLVAQYECRQCHRIAGSGAIIAPDLSGVTSRHDDLVLRMWLRNPKAVKGNTAMPDFRLSDSEIEALVAYFKSVDASQAGGQ